MSIIFLDYENIMDINEGLYQKAQKYNGVEYTGKEDYDIHHYKIRALTRNIPDEDIIDVATFYLKNIILLQSFPDGNHRTGLIATELFLEKNGMGLSFTYDDAIRLEKELYAIRFQIYRSYQEHDISVLTEERNEMFYRCKQFITEHLTQSS